MAHEKIPDQPGRRGAVAIVVRQEKLLVIRRSRQVVAPRMYCFPGGGIEGQETQQEALIREIREELGVKVEPRRQIWECVTPWKVHLAWWQCRLESSHVLRPNPAEVESVHWLAAEEMARLPALLESNRRFLDALRRGEIVLEP